MIENEYLNFCSRVKYPHRWLAQKEERGNFEAAAHMPLFERRGRNF